MNIILKTKREGWLFGRFDLLISHYPQAGRQKENGDAALDLEQRGRVRPVVGPVGDPLRAGEHGNREYRPQMVLGERLRADLHERQTPLFGERREDVGVFDRRGPNPGCVGRLFKQALHVRMPFRVVVAFVYTLARNADRGLKVRRVDVAVSPIVGLCCPCLCAVMRDEERQNYIAFACHNVCCLWVGFATTFPVFIVLINNFASKCLIIKHIEYICTESR